MREDPAAVNQVFQSAAQVYQIPQNVYHQVEISLAEISLKVASCGKIGSYLAKELFELNELYGKLPVQTPFPHGESWCLGDNAACGVLLQSTTRVTWHAEKTPQIDIEQRYLQTEGTKKELRVYDLVDTRLILADLFAKLKLCYS